MNQVEESTIIFDKALKGLRNQLLLTSSPKKQGSLYILQAAFHANKMQKWWETQSAIFKALKFNKANSSQPLLSTPSTGPQLCIIKNWNCMFFNRIYMHMYIYIERIVYSTMSIYIHLHKVRHTHREAVY